MFLRFLRDRRGSILPTFAIVLVPLIVATGAVVDYSNAFDERTVVQDAMDNAALAAGKQIGVLTTDQVKAEATAFFNSNVAGRVSQTPTLVSAVTGANVDLSTTLTVKTYFLGLIGLNQFVFNLKSQVTQAMGTLEVALVLDNSGSMAGTKISTLITAAQDLNATLYDLAATTTKPDPVKVALVPFAGSVNVGSSNRTSGWMDTTAVNPYHGDNLEPSSGSPPVSTNSPSVNLFTLFDSMSGAANAWAGCVEERPIPYDVQDDAASTDIPKTMFVPMFAPDEPDNWTCNATRCPAYAGSGTTVRYNTAPTGTRSNNNYLPDVGAGGTCGPAVTMTSATPTVFTRNAHGLTAGTEIAFQTSGALYTGLTAGTLYYAVAAGLTTNTFMLSAASSATSGVTIAPATVNAITSITRASPGVVNDTAHGLAATNAIVFSTTGTLPAPLTAGTTYYVKTVTNANAFTVSATSGGTVINTTTNGSGSHSWNLAAPTVFTKSSHGLVVGDAIFFATTGALPANVTANTVYYVKTRPSTSTFTIATTAAGAGIVATGTQSGTHSFTKLIRTSGSQSGTHTYTLTSDWTCGNGTDKCAAAGNPGSGRSETTALLGTNIAASPLCKYGTAAKQSSPVDIDVSVASTGYDGGPNFMCTTKAIEPLTTSESTIDTKIGQMKAYGITNITAGLMWGWRVLSSTAPFTEGRTTADYDNQKIIVLMTDGDNTYFPNGKFTQSYYGAWGYIVKQHLGIDTSDQYTMEDAEDDRLEIACANVKEASIKVYTIAFQVTNETTLGLLSDCATKPSMAYQSSNSAELLAAFTAIGDEISLLRLAK